MIAYVAHIGQADATTLDILPNPLSAEADGLLGVAGDTIRYRFRKG